MARHDSSYSRFVVWAKIFLMLAALGTLSTIFFVAKTIEPLQTIPYADISVSDLTREQRIGNPNYSGVTKNGSSIALFAEAARPDLTNPSQVDVDKLSAEIEDPNGRLVSITSPKAMVDTVHQLAQLTGGVLVKSSDGYTIKAPNMDVSMKQSQILATQGVTVEGPQGQVKAESMTIETISEQKYLLVFNGSVKLVYQP
jgi:lipopolysaccharide export system protein LptC